MAGLNESNVERKFQSVGNTQDSIQSLGLWVIHHKAHHEKIVDIWFKVLKKSKIPHRLTLFYLCNDIVQTCKRKHAIVYKDAFKEVLKDAVLLVRDSSVRRNVERIFKIWEERNVYDGEFIEEVGGLLANVKSRATLNTRLLAEFQPSKVMEQISLFSELERTMKLRAKYVSGLKLDSTSIDAVRQLKDKAHGKEFSQQFEDTCVKVEDYVVQLERTIKERTSLIEMLEQSELFYDAQYGEAKIVANAYKNFGARVANLKKKLEDHKHTLPSPVDSPALDAPSPGDTPPGMTEAMDHMGSVDMELSDDDDDSPPMEKVVRVGGDVTHTTMAYPLPICSSWPPPSLSPGPGDSPLTPRMDAPSPSHSVSSAPSPEGSPILGGSPKGKSGPVFPAYPGLAEDLTPAPLLAAREKWRALKQKKAQAEGKVPGEPGLAQPIPTVSSSRIERIDFSPLGEDLEDEEGTPTKDEQENRAGTPVQDEMEVEIEMKAEAKSNVSNPIEFLTQLISQTQQTQPSSQSSADFMQSLSALTRNVQYSAENSTVQGSWGGWKDPKPGEEIFGPAVPQPVSAPLADPPGGMSIPNPPLAGSSTYTPTPPAAIPMPVAPPSLQSSLTMPTGGPRPVPSMSPLTPPTGGSSQPSSLHRRDSVTSPPIMSPQSRQHTPHTPLHGPPSQTPPITPTPLGMQHPPAIPQPIPPPRGMLPPQTPPSAQSYGPPGFNQQPPHGPRFPYQAPSDNDSSWQHPPQSPHGQYNQQSPPANNTPSPGPHSSNSRPNLTQIRTVDLDQSKETFRQVTSSPAFRGGPRPPFPHGGHQNVQDEFTEKLRRKTSITSPTTPGVSSNLRNLTLVSTSEDARGADTPQSSSPGSAGTASSTPSSAPGTPSQAPNDWNRPAPHNASGDWGRPMPDWDAHVRSRVPSIDGPPPPHMRHGSNGEAPRHMSPKGFRERQPGRFGHWPRLPGPGEGDYRDPYGRPHPKRMPQQGAFMRY